MEHPLPQFLDIKPKIAGPLTLHQLIYVGGIGIIILILFSVLPFGKFIMAAIPLAIISFFLAFGKIRGFPAPTVLARSFSFIFTGKIYLWQQKTGESPKLAKAKKKEGGKQKRPETSLKIAEGSRLKKLGNIIEIHN